jgi:hypothetical protein
MLRRVSATADTLVLAYPRSAPPPTSMPWWRTGSTPSVRPSRHRGRNEGRYTDEAGLSP